MTTQQRIEKSIKEIKNISKGLKELGMAIDIFIKAIPEEKPSVWVPDWGEDCYYVNNVGEIKFFTYQSAFSELPEKQQKYGNLFKTKEQAELHKLRLESMAQRGEMPKDGERFWCWSFRDSIPFSVYPTFILDYVSHWWIGCVKKTREECQDWANKYLEAWTVD